MGAALLLSLMLYGTTGAQVPQQLNYQGALRNSNGQPITNRQISLRISILDGENGPVAYSEVQRPTTSNLGLYALQIGNSKATQQVGKISAINWGEGRKYIRVEADENGGGNYVLAGTSELLSVPYALYAANSAPGAKGDTGPAGERGERGEKGEKGDKGEPGEATEARAIGPWYASENGQPAEKNGQHIYQSAHVGIMTTAPVTPLDVRGAVRFGTPATGKPIGANSAAFGHENTASGANAASFGLANISSGAYSTTFGTTNTASGSRSTVFGTMSQVSGDYSTSFGSSNTVAGWMSMAIGGNLKVPGNFQTVVGTNNAMADVQETLFQIGNGNPNIPTELSNAITIKRNGHTMLGTSVGLPNSTLQVAGSLSLPIRSIIDGGPGDDDYTLLVRGPIYLPAADQKNKGRIYQLVNDTAEQQLIRGNVRINGKEEPGLALDIQDGHRAATVQSDGRSWVVLSMY